MRPFKRELLAQDVRGLLHHLLGSSRLGQIVFTVLTLAALGWFADSCYGVLTAWVEHWALGKPMPTTQVYSALWLTAPLVVLLTLGLIVARRAVRRLVFRVRSSREPRGVRALILFLSVPRGLDADAAVTGSIHDPAVRARLAGPWRMLLEALVFHDERRLEHAIVIESRAAGSKPGSRESRDEFFALLDRLWPERSVLVRPASDLVPELDDGVDFFDLGALVQATDEVLRRLVGETGLRREQVVIDVTGGTKIATAAGAAVALAEGRRFQYVATHDYGVTVYDPTYEQPLQGAAR
ncbi:MAG: hypothetical protein AAGC60_06125 [Acidobacteriota bacterium]